MDSRKKTIEIVVRAIIVHKDRLLINVWKNKYAFLPGGKVKNGESLQEALIREIEEELNYTITPGPLFLMAENFFRQKLVLVHEIGFYFLAEPTKSLFPVDRSRINPDAPDLLFRYAPLCDLSLLDMRPRQLIPLLTAERLKKKNIAPMHKVFKESETSTII